MFDKTTLSRSLFVAFNSMAAMAGGSVFAQQTTTPAPTELQRVEITGSAIKRIDAETAVPVTVVKMDDLKKSGITTIEQVISTLTAVQGGLGTNFSVGCSNCGGAAFADLRGIGQNKTLVLLNGRRIANNAIDGTAPDLNVIPFAAIERVEVLRDGASALYGTDAIGGVINFITRREFTGGTITAGFDSPNRQGGNSHQLNLGLGYGDLDQQGFNVFGFFDYQNQKNITGSQREFNNRIPGGLSGSTSPANYFQDGAVVGNPAATSCAGAGTTFLIPAGDDTSCIMSTSKFVDFAPKSERTSGLLKGTLKLGEDHKLGVEYFFTKTVISTQIAPVPFGALVQNPFRPDGTANPFYPGNSGAPFTPAFALDPNYDDGSVGSQMVNGGSAIQKGFVNVKWRDVPNGPRGDENTNLQQRFVTSLEGNVAGWDYQAAASFTNSRVEQRLTSGYNNGDLITEGVLDGVINPYGPQTADGSALLNSAALPGLLVTSRGSVKAVDAHASREVGDWFGAGRPAAVAVGAEYRREAYVSAANTPYATLVVASTGTDPNTLNQGKRNVIAGYTELNVPILSSLDVTAALRYDKYSDFGNTTNPKISFRFQPIQPLLFRGSYSTGFRAPSLYEINANQAYANTGSENNPFTCPGGNPAEGFSSVNNCDTQFQSLTGGNKNLKPEKAKNATLGLVLEPFADTSVSLDFWWVRIKQTIGSIPETTLFGPQALTTFANYFFPLANGALSVDGTQCPGANCGYVDLRTQNLGGTNTSGIDFSASYKLRMAGYGQVGFGLNSTYVAKYEYQDYEGGPWNQNVGSFVGSGPVFRWQHNLSVNWALDPFTVGVTGHYKSGYGDQDPTNHVGSYTTFDLYGSVAATKALTVTAGVRNAFDRDPPFSNQTLNFQGGGYDSRYTDPTGRAFYVRGTYTF